MCLRTPARTLLKLLFAVIVITVPLLHAQQANQLSHVISASSSQTTPDTPLSAIDVLNGILAQYQRTGNQDAQAHTLCALGNAYESAGHRQKGIEEFQLALGLYRQTGNKSGEVKTLSQIGDAYRSWGFPDKAVGFYRDALLGYSRIDDKPGKAIALNNLGVAYLSLRDKKKSLEYLDRALAAYRDTRDRHGEASALINIGAAQSMLAHDSGRALEALRKAIDELEPLNDRSNEADAFEMIGVVWTGLHKQELADANFNRALAIYRQIGDPKGEASVLKHMRDQGRREDIAMMR
jgi:tetratricopeptide (TPR) repeat protein